MYDKYFNCSHTHFEATTGFPKDVNLLPPVEGEEDHIKDNSRVSGLNPLSHYIQAKVCLTGLSIQLLRGLEAMVLTNI